MIKRILFSFLYASLIFPALVAKAQNPPQKVNAQYEFQGVWNDSVNNVPFSIPTNSIFKRRGGHVWYDSVDKKIHWTTDMSGHDTTFSGGNGNVFKFNVLNFGAVKDSTVNNTSSFQTAINAAAVMGGTVYVPNGVWSLGILHIPSNVYIYGEDQGTILKCLSDTLLSYDAPKLAPLFLYLGYSPNSNFSINANGICHVPISAFFVYWMRWSDVNMYNFPSTGTSIGLYLRGSLSGEIDNFTIYGATYSVFGDTASTPVESAVAINLLTFQNDRFYHASKQGVYINETQGLINFIGCDFEDDGSLHDQTTGALWMNNAGTSPVVTLDNTWFEQDEGVIFKCNIGGGQINMMAVNMFANPNSSIGIDIIGTSPGNYLNLIGSTIENDSLDIKIDGNTLATNQGSILGTNSLGVQAPYLIKKYPLPGQQVGFTTTSNVGILTAGSGAGSGATISANSVSSSGGGSFTLTTGTGTSSGLVATVALENASYLSIGNIPVWSPGNSNSVGAPIYAQPTTTFPYQLQFFSSSALTASTAYVINYVIIGK